MSGYRHTMYDGIVTPKIGELRACWPLNGILYRKLTCLSSALSLLLQRRLPHPHSPTIITNSPTHISCSSRATRWNWSGPMAMKECMLLLALTELGAAPCPLLMGGSRRWNAPANPAGTSKFDVYPASNETISVRSASVRERTASLRTRNHGRSARPTMTVAASRPWRPRWPS